MKQEDKQLLFKDLSARIPYGVICTDDKHGDSRVTQIDINPTNNEIEVYYWDFDEYGFIENCKPYLRPWSDLSEHELIDLKHAALVDNEGVPGDISAYVDWLNAHDVDFRDLIGKHLAYNKSNMYKYD